MNPQESKPNIADAQYVADALWLDVFDWQKIPTEIKQKLSAEAHSPEAYGAKMRRYVQWLLDHPQSFNPSYRKRYRALLAAIDTLTPHQAYTICSKFLGSDAVQGFDPIPPVANLQFPRDHQPKWHSQVGWHFFVGSVWAEDGQEYGVELMFFRVSLLPPKLAKEMGLSDIENQVAEVQLGISKAGEKHHQADPTVVAGTSGLIEHQAKPFLYRLGKNEIRGLSNDKFFPLTIKARGLDRSGAEPFELGLDIELTSGKEYLLQGDDGCMPSVAGMGSLYYSIPSIEIKAGSTLQYGDQKIKLKKGLLWFDHQWGFLGGNPNAAVLRAANNISAPAPAGWDWYMAQFDGNRQITMFANHSKKNLPYYYRSGSVPPATMKVPVAGKYMDENKQLHNTWGTLRITKWIQANTSSNPQLYPVTHVWHPNEWEFRFDDTMPEDIRHFSMHQVVPSAQTNFFANGSQYNEGAVYLRDRQDRDIGRGFAEAVEYANTRQNQYSLAGFAGNQALTEILSKKPVASWPRRIQSIFYVMTHQKELKKVLGKAKGLEFFSAPAKKLPASRHQ